MKSTTPHPPPSANGLGGRTCSADRQSQSAWPSSGASSSVHCLLVTACNPLAQLQSQSDSLRHLAPYQTHQTGRACRGLPRRLICLTTLDSGPSLWAIQHGRDGLRSLSPQARMVLFPVTCPHRFPPMPPHSCSTAVRCHSGSAALGLWYEQGRWRGQCRS
jgi:hypothetical protein